MVGLIVSVVPTHLHQNAEWANHEAGTSQDRMACGSGRSFFWRP